MMKLDLNWQTVKTSQDMHENENGIGIWRLSLRREGAAPQPGNSGGGYIIHLTINYHEESS